MSKSHQLQEIGQRLDTVEALLDELTRSMERIELVTVIREPNTGMSADAYNGLRKQVIAAVSERIAHLNQLAQFDSALKVGADVDELAVLVREWLGQSSLEVVEDPAHDGAFELVGPETAAGRRLVRPAYVDRITGRVIRAGIAERVELVDADEDVAYEAAAGESAAYEAATCESAAGEAGPFEEGPPEAEQSIAGGET